MTGDRRYLNPIPDAISWLEKSKLETFDDGRIRLANYYEPGTNKPLYMHITGEFNEQGYGLYRWDNDSTGTKPWDFKTIDIKALKREHEHERLRALSAGEAAAEYKAKKALKPVIPEVDPQKVKELIDSLDERGAWVEEISVYGSTNNDPDYPWANTKIQGITTQSFETKMRTFIHYLKTIK